MSEFYFGALSVLAILALIFYALSELHDQAPKPKHRKKG